MPLFGIVHQLVVCSTPGASHSAAVCSMHMLPCGAFQRAKHQALTAGGACCCCCCLLLSSADVVTACLQSSHLLGLLLQR
jgi:hypothetical protein